MWKQTKHENQLRANFLPVHTIKSSFTLFPFAKDSQYRSITIDNLEKLLLILARQRCWVYFSDGIWIAMKITIHVEARINISKTCRRVEKCESVNQQTNAKSAQSIHNLWTRNIMRINRFAFAASVKPFRCRERSGSEWRSFKVAAVTINESTELFG